MTSPSVGQLLRIVPILQFVHLASSVWPDPVRRAGETPIGLSMSTLVQERGGARRSVIARQSQYPIADGEKVAFVPRNRKDLMTRRD